MTEPLSGFFYQLTYLFTHITTADVVDILLVAAVFFIVFQALHRTRAMQLLRGAIIIAILGLALLFLLPLTTFGWLLRGVLFAGAIALPLLFQDELRRMLTGLGQLGRRRGYGSNFERFKNTISTAVKQLAEKQRGALIVLEGQTSLDDIVATGIPLHAETLTPELLLTIFHPNTALHDGAVILSGDRLVAAGCILPLETEKTGPTHLGTRHRAALGLSAKFPDTMTIIVSEETGRISVTQAGRIYMGLSLEQLGEQMNRFSSQITGQAESRFSWLRGGGLVSSLSNLLTATLLAIIAWVSVSYQTNPPQMVSIKNVPLTVTGPSSDMVLMSEIPDSVRVQAQTTLDRIDELDANIVRAEMNIDELTEGFHRVPVEVFLGDDRSQLVSVIPDFVDVALEERLTIMMTPTVTILDPDSLPLGYTLDDLSISPESVTLQGPKSLVEQVAEVKAELTLGDRRADFQQTLSLTVLDETGEPVADLRPSPERILATVTIDRTFFTRDIAIQADLAANTVEDGYEIVGVELSPATVTIIGTPSTLATAGEFLSTAPISLTAVHSDLIIDVPILLPQGVPAIDADGENVNSITAHITVAPITDYLVLNLRPAPEGLTSDLYARIIPSMVSALLTGPQPLLDQIRSDPSMVSAFVDVTGLTVGEYTLLVEVLAPQGLEIELFPSEVQVSLYEQPEN